MDRFLREARAAAQLSSPHVVHTIDFGIEGETPFIVMELLEGETLAQRLARVGRLPVEETARLLTDVARALTRAHQADIVHRDLEPENIFVVRNDDTEIAKVLAATGSFRDRAHPRRLRRVVRPGRGPRPSAPVSDRTGDGERMGSSLRPAAKPGFESRRRSAEPRVARRSATPTPSRRARRPPTTRRHHRRRRFASDVRARKREATTAGESTRATASQAGATAVTVPPARRAASLAAGLVAAAGFAAVAATTL